MIKKSNYIGASLLLSLLFFQVVGFAMAFSPQMGDISTLDENGDDGALITAPASESHSSPFYFPVEQSSKLQSVPESADDSESAPRSAYYDDEGPIALSTHLEKYAFVQDESVTIHLTLTYNLLPIEDSLITLRIYRGFHRGDYSYTPNYYDSVLVEEIILPTNTAGEATHDFTSTQIEGIYTIEAMYNSYQNYETFSVGDLGVFTKGSQYYQEGQPYTTSLQILNISNFSPLTSQDYTYKLEKYDSGVDLWTSITEGVGTTDSYGYSLITTEPLNVTEDAYYYWYSVKLTISTTKDSSTAAHSNFIYKTWDSYYYSLWGGEQVKNSDRYQFVATTDKTIYNPGEFIHYRVLVFEYSYLEETRTQLPETSVLLTVYNPDELAIFWLHLTTDSLGVLTFDFPMDEDCDLGVYGFEFSLEEVSFRHNLKVQYYEKPVFRVSIDTYGKDFFPEENGWWIFSNSVDFAGFVETAYYFGQPVIGAEVKLTLFTYWGEEKHSVSGITNGEGRLYFSIDLDKIDNLYYSFTAKAEVVDTYGRSAISEKRYSRMEDLYIYGYLSEWAPIPTEKLNYYFSAYQFVMGGYGGYEYNPLADVDVSIDVYGITEVPIIIETIDIRTHLKTFYADTNIYGSGNLNFDLDWDDKREYNMFEIEITVTLEDGRTEQSSTYFRYRKYSLDVVMFDREFESGETVDFSVNYFDTLSNQILTGEGWLRIYDSNYKLVGQSQLELSGSQHVAFKIPTYASEGDYYISSYVRSRPNNFYGGFFYSSDYEKFTVGVSESIQLSSNASTESGGREVSVYYGDTLEISGNADILSNTPYYFEIYKRGLLSSERLEISSDSFNYTLPITTKLGPDFTIMVYTISAAGNIIEAALVVHIESKFSIALATDKDMYEPGDSVTLTITPENDSPLLLALSFIDSAVLDVEPEDDSELGYFSSDRYYAYISSGSSWGTGRRSDNYWWINYQSHTGGMYWPFRYYDGDVMYEMANDGHAKNERTGDGGSMPPPTFDDLLLSFDTEVRDNISESANWIPSLLLSESHNFTFKLPDNIGEWTIRVVANNFDASAGEHAVVWGEITTIQIKTALPFFVEFQIPEPVLQDEIITIKSYIYNYLGEDLWSYVSINAPGFSILNNPTQKIYVPDNYVAEVEFTLFATLPFTSNVTILAATEAASGDYSDAKLLPIYVHPQGIAIESRDIGFLNASESPLELDYELYDSTIYHKESMVIYSDLMDVSLTGWESLIGYPYGCIEQTISKLLPTVNVYDYLNSTENLSNRMALNMEMMILEGLGRIYSFQHSDGGWGWWESDQSRVQMTTIVINALNEVNRVGFRVNQEVINRGIDFLLDEIGSDTYWEFEYQTANNFEATALVLKTLIGLEDKSILVNSTIDDKISLLESNWDNPSFQSPYGAALMLSITLNSSYGDPILNSQMIDYLLANKESSEGLTYWTNPDGYYWRNLGNDVEITSLVLEALAKDDYIGHLPVIQNAFEFLISKQNRWGWSSTADTSSAIGAITVLKELSNDVGLIDFEGYVSIIVDNSESSLIELNLTEGGSDPDEILIDLTDILDGEHTNISVELNGTGSISYVFETTQILRFSPSISVDSGMTVAPGETFALSFSVTGIENGFPVGNFVAELVQYGSFNLIGTSPTIAEDLVFDGDVYSYTLEAPSTSGIYTIEGLDILGYIIDPNNLSSSPDQLFTQFIGPITITVGNSPVSAGIQTYQPSTYIISPPISSSQSEITSGALDSILLMKDLQVEGLIPGSLMSVDLCIVNSGDLLRYYTLDDALPNGGELVTDSVEVYFNGSLIHSELTYEVSAGQLHFFISEIPRGELRITYHVLLGEVKRTVLLGSRLWGMYDSFTLQLSSTDLASLPIKYNTDNSIMTDVDTPVIGDVSAKQSRSQDELLGINFGMVASDNTYLYKGRVVFNDGSGWRSQTWYLSGADGELNLELNNLPNEDAKITYYIEILDIYGNIIVSEPLVFRLQSNIIPYVTMGLVVGLTIGLTVLGMKGMKKYGWKKKKDVLLLDEESKPVSFSEPESED